MTETPDPLEVAAALRASLGLLFRRVRQAPLDDALTFPERAALSRLEQVGPATTAEVARLEQIRPQSMGATVAALERRGLVDRERDPADRRRVVLAVTAAGRQMLGARRSARTEQLAQALEAEFTQAELKRLQACVPLLERLAGRL